MDTKKLFHAIVIMGMTTATACSSSTPDPGQDAAANDSSTTKDTGGGQDVTTNPDTGTDTDAGDAAKGWLGC